MTDETKYLLTESADTLAELAGVDISTARRWKARGSLPVPVERLLTLVLLGDLTPLGWPGWTLFRGQLQSPEGWAYLPGEVLSLTLLRAQVAHLEAERRSFLALEPQPKPSDIAKEAHDRNTGDTGTD